MKFSFRFSLIFFLSFCSLNLFSQNFTNRINQSELSGFFQNFYNQHKVNPTQTDFENNLLFFNKDPLDEIKQRASWTFSAMIYGLSFSFVPNSLLYKVERSFDLNLKGEIKSEAISYEQTIFESDKTGSLQNPIEYLATYKAAKFELRRREMWQQSNFLNCNGTGSVLFNSPTAHDDAIKQAIQNGVVALFQEKLINKPRMIEGNIYILATPRLFKKGDRLFAQVSFLVEEKLVEHYLVP